MARLGRYFLPDQPLHVIQRGNNREPVFFARDDYRHYLGWLDEAAAEYGVRLHAYVLMTNHVHLLATPEDAEALPRMMQSLGRRYMRHVNGLYRRTGTLLGGRYRAAPIEADRHFLATMRYIELNPVRARMVRKPENYPWSSHRAHVGAAHPREAGGGSGFAAGPVLADHALYRALGATPAARARNYLALFRLALPAEFVAELRAATNGGWALGSDKWRAKAAKVAARRTDPLPRGRPRKEPQDGGRQGKLL